MFLSSQKKYVLLFCALVNFLYMALSVYSPLSLISGPSLLALLCVFFFSFVCYLFPSLLLPIDYDSGLYLIWHLEGCFHF